jgi:hypothetical protein
MLALGVVAPASYALQRLVTAWSGVEDQVIVAQVHVPYYWRCAVAGLHGVLVASLVGFGLSDARCAALLRHGRWVVALVVGPAALAMVLVP